MYSEIYIIFQLIFIYYLTFSVFNILHFLQSVMATRLRETMIHRSAVKTVLTLLKNNNFN